MKAPEQLIAEFDRYVLSDIPMRLIYIPEMRLVEREFVRSHYQQKIDSFTEAEIVQWDSAENLVASVVRYAILSHRWGAKEPTYADLVGKRSDRLRRASVTYSHHRRISVDEGPGYAKLNSFCREARRRGYVFAWSDTCCIDKSSSAELDESIRSMFKWYQNSALCIVHLSQTKHKGEIHGDEWFIRGWTLQELLAPRWIKFFNASWNALTSDENDKDITSPLLRSISDITEIPYFNIAAFSPLPYAIDTRMTWAAKRVTTRAEDAAYSLMGLFGVSFQIAYGEGADRAFARLIQAIMLSGSDLSVLNWTGKHAAVPGTKALPRSPANYVGHWHPTLDVPFRSRRSMEFTRRGLRTSLVVLPVSLVPASLIENSPPRLHPKTLTPHNGAFAWHSTFRDGAFVVACETPVRFKTEVSPLASRELLGNKSLALGILNYELIREDYNPSLAKESVAYLLKNEEASNEYHARCKDFIGWMALEKGNIVTVGEKWQIVPCRDFVKFSIDGGPPSHIDARFYVSRDYVEEVYL